MTAPRPETGTLLIVQSIKERGPIAVEMACRCVIVYPQWLRGSGGLPLRVADVVLVVGAAAGRVRCAPSIGADAEAPMYFVGEPMLELGCGGHRAGP